MEDFDKLIDEINQRTKQVLSNKLGARIHFVDLYALSSAYDRKHGAEVEPLWVEHRGTRRRLSNFPFSALGGFRHGGLFSLDNMHPTIAGYSLLANAIGEAISATEGLPFRPMTLQDAHDSDTLLQRPPVTWDFLMLLASLAGAFVDLD